MSGADYATISFVTPASWVVVDVDPRTRDRSIERMIKQQMGPSDELATLRRRAVVAFRDMAAEAAERGAFFAATLSEMIEKVPVSASFLAFILPGVTDDGGAPITDVDVIATVLGHDAEGETELERSIVELGIGPAFRLRALCAAGVESSDGAEPRVDVVRYFVPMPEAGVIMVLAFSTPILELGDALAELFHEIALSASWRPVAP